MDLELKIISATDITKSSPFTKNKAYVVVSIPGGPFPSQKTPVDGDGDRNPNWNHPLTFSFPGGFSRAADLTLKFEIRSCCSLAGEVCVPLRDLFDSALVGKIPAPANFVSYQVKKPSGRPQGVLTFSYRFKAKISGAAAAAAEEQIVNFPVKPQTTSLYPVPEDVYPPLPKPSHSAWGFPAVDGYRYDVYPPPPPVDAFPATVHTSYGYPVIGGLGYGYPVQTANGHSATWY
ncbi:hypothetical protein V2J09_014293 [Rumex salicifolius]